MVGERQRLSYPTGEPSAALNVLSTETTEPDVVSLLKAPSSLQRRGFVTGPTCAARPSSGRGQASAVMIVAQGGHTFGWPSCYQIEQRSGDFLCHNFRGLLARKVAGQRNGEGATVAPIFFDCEELRCRSWT